MFHVSPRTLLPFPQSSVTVFCTKAWREAFNPSVPVSAFDPLGRADGLDRSFGRSFDRSFGQPVVKKTLTPEDFDSPQLQCQDFFIRW